MKTVIGFDSWTQGAQHFARLIPALKAIGLDLQLVHIGSWGNEPDIPTELRIGELLVRDIKYYGKDNLELILDREQPVAVILLSTDTFAHRAFIRYCNQRTIPTLNLYHGLVNVQDSVFDSGDSGVSRIAHLWYVLSKIKKLLQHTLPCYIKSLWKTQASDKDWVQFLVDIFDLATGTKGFKKSSSDAKTSKCAVYVDADVEHAIRCYGFNKEDVFVVGNPDFLQFGLEQGMIGHWEPPKKAGEISIMYIECGFASVGLHFDGAQGFITHLIDTSRSLATQGFKLYIKLKPHQLGIHLLEQSLKSAGIELVSNDAFLSKLMVCSACIVETTTLSMVPSMLGMPLFLAQFGDLKSLRYGSVLTSYPRSYFLQDISDLSAILTKDAQISHSEKIAQWLDLNAGPLPPEKMPERVAAIIKKMIVDAKRSELT